MKIIITSYRQQPQSKFDLRFGRVAWFCVYDTDQKTIEFIENANKNANGGAGTKTVEVIAKWKLTRLFQEILGQKQNRCWNN